MGWPTVIGTDLSFHASGAAIKFNGGETAGAGLAKPSLRGAQLHFLARRLHKRGGRIPSEATVWPNVFCVPATAVGPGFAPQAFSLWRYAGEMIPSGAGARVGPRRPSCRGVRRRPRLRKPRQETTAIEAIINHGACW